MSSNDFIDWPALWQAAISRFALGEASIHGAAHWRRVERYGIMLAEHSEGEVLVVRLFALFHDVCRLSDQIDHEHGARGAVLAACWRGQYFELPDASFELLQEACRRHTAGLVSDDPTLGACWDANRLNLWRAGITPQATLMSTTYARELVLAKKIGPQYLPPER